MLHLFMVILTIFNLNTSQIHRLVIYPPEDTLFFRENPVGGIILFKEHFNDTSKLRKYIAAAKRNNPYKMKVFVDMEGGAVNRLKEIDNFKNLPSPYEMVYEHYTADSIYKEWIKVSAFLKMLGIDVNIAPSLDFGYGLMGRQKRSYGENPLKHRDLIFAFIKAMHKNNIEVIIKHYPGYGKLQINTDIQAGTLLITKRELKKYIKPFEIFGPIADGIMLSSIIYPIIDSLPADLSPAFISMAKHTTDGYTITDDINSKGIKKLYPNSLKKALKTDVDYIIYIDPFINK